jgi:hypothetical protein
MFRQGILERQRQKQARKQEEQRKAAQLQFEKDNPKPIQPEQLRAQPDVVRPFTGFLRSYGQAGQDNGVAQLQQQTEQDEVKKYQALSDEEKKTELARRTKQANQGYIKPGMTRVVDPTTGITTTQPTARLEAQPYNPTQPATGRMGRMEVGPVKPPSVRKSDFSQSDPNMQQPLIGPQQQFNAMQQQMYQTQPVQQEAQPEQPTQQQNQLQEQQPKQIEQTAPIKKTFIKRKNTEM